MNKKNKPTLKLCDIDYPCADKIGSRTSTIARSMASTIMPRIPSTDEDKEAIRKILFPDNNIACVYCGKDGKNEKLTLDHLHPLIKNSSPSGYFTEPNNLVPCCKDCNGSKGNDEWEEYMVKLSKSKPEGWEERNERLKKLCADRPAHKIRVSQELNEIWTLCDKLCKELEACQQKIDIFIGETNLQVDGNNTSYNDNIIDSISEFQEKYIRNRISQLKRNIEKGKGEDQKIDTRKTHLENLIELYGEK